MAKVSKRTVKEIQAVSVFDSILRERFTSTLTPYFADDRTGILERRAKGNLRYRLRSRR